MTTRSNVSINDIASLTLAALKNSGADVAVQTISRIAKQQRQTSFTAADILSEVARLIHRSHPAEALLLANRAINEDPDQNSARVTIGIIEDSLGKKVEARATMRKVLKNGKATPEQILIATNLLIRLDDDPRVSSAAFEAFDALQKPIRWADTLLYIALRTAEWGRVDELCKQLMDSHINGTISEAKEKPRNNLMWCADEEINLRVLKNWSKLEFPVVAKRPAHSYDSKRKLRIGYLSSDFREHPTARLVNGLFRNHDKEKFELYIYCSGWDDGSVLRKEVLAQFDHVRTVTSLSDEAAAALISTDNLDILVELNGPTRAHRMGILAHRPAPIQIDYLGWPGSVGGRVVDYVIGDPYTVPKDAELKYPEKVIRIESVYQVNDYRSYVRDDLPDRAKYGLPDDGRLVIGMFNSINKVRFDVWCTWMEILKRSPRSVFWILDPGKAARANLARWTKKLGVDPKRIIVAPALTHAAHLARLQCCDLMLDPWPYGGHTSTSDALFAGVPVIALEGTNFAGRVSGALLHAAGLGILVCKTKTSYVRLSLRLLNDQSELSRVKKFVRENVMASSVFDAKSRALQIEAAYEAAIKRSIIGKDPCHMRVVSGEAIEEEEAAPLDANRPADVTALDAAQKIKVILVCGAWGGGTSAVTGLLAQAGLTAPGPHVTVNDPKTPCTYEMKAFQAALRQIASERSLKRTADAHLVKKVLTEFRDNDLMPIARTNGLDKSIVLKHGLAALFLNELSELFDLRIIGVLRPMLEIEKTRERRNWFPSMGAQGAKEIFSALFEHIVNQPTPFHLVRFTELLVNPAKVLDELCVFCEFHPEQIRRQDAIKSVSQRK